MARQGRIMNKGKPGPCLALAVWVRSGRLMVRTTRTTTRKSTKIAGSEPETKLS